MNFCSARFLPMFIRQAYRKRLGNSIILSAIIATLLFSPSLQDATHSFFHFIGQTNCRAKNSLHSHSSQKSSPENELTSAHDNFCSLRYFLTTSSHSPLILPTTPVFLSIEKVFEKRVHLSEESSPFWYYGSHSARGPPA
jgi:hypothetical protein